MAEVLRKLDMAAESEVAGLRKRLAEETSRRERYQNRYYQAVARNAELEDELERFRIREAAERERRSHLAEVC